MNTEMPKIRPEIDMEALRNRIRSTLSEQRMTVQNLSEKTGIPKSTLDGFLNRGTTPAFDTGALVCAVLSIPVDSITGASAPAELPEKDAPNTELLSDIKDSYLREISSLPSFIAGKPRRWRRITTVPWKPCSRPMPLKTLPVTSILPKLAGIAACGG